MCITVYNTRFQAAACYAFIYSDRVIGQFYLLSFRDDSTESFIISMSTFLLITMQGFVAALRKLKEK